MCTIIYAVAIGASFQSEWIPSADRTERQQISTSCAHADPACLRRAPDPMPGPVRIVPELWSTWPSLDIIMITPRATNGGWAPDNQGMYTGNIPEMALVVVSVGGWTTEVAVPCVVGPGRANVAHSQAICSAEKGGGASCGVAAGSCGAAIVSLCTKGDAYNQHSVHRTFSSLLLHICHEV